MIATSRVLNDCYSCVLLMGMTNKNTLKINLLVPYKTECMIAVQASTPT